MALTKAFPSFESLFGSATISIVASSHQENEPMLLPGKIHDLSEELNLFYCWEEDLIKNLFDEEEFYSKFRIIQEFATKLIENTEDINPKFAKLADKHFWDLI